MNGGMNKELPAMGKLKEFGLIIIAIAVAILSMLLTRTITSSSRERQFDRMMKEWSENARTNTVVETTARFRDEVLVPFVKRELPNPFEPGGAEADKPWSKEARDVFDAGLRIACDGSWGMWAPDMRVCRRANALTKQGCENPLILILSVFDPAANYLANEKRSREILGRAREIVDKTPRNEFLQTLLCYYRWLAKVSDKGDRTRDFFIAWVKARDFGDDDEIPIFALCTAFCGEDSSLVFEACGRFRWAGAMQTAKVCMFEGMRRAGLGVASKIATGGWMTLREKTRIAGEFLDEAEKLRPGRVEPTVLRLRLDGESRRGRRAREDDLFMEISHKLLDDEEALDNYVWHRLYPRWSQTRGYGEMLRFAQACYDTGRHDTMIPYYYAKVQCCYVRDTNTNPFQYFSENAEIADRCIDVCMRQATNEYACGYSRIMAPFVGAAVAYYAGRYEDAACFDRYIQYGAWHMHPLKFIFSDVDEISDKAAIFACANSNEFIRLQRMFDGGRYAEVMSGIDELRKGGALKKDKYWSDSFSLEMALAVRMKTEFVEGKDVEAKIPAYLHGWWGSGWWRCGDLVMQTYRPFEWKNHFTWRAKLPKAHEIEFTLEPKPKTTGRHVLVLSRFVHEESHHLPINGIPFLTLIWEEGRTGAYFEDDYYNMFNVKPNKAEWVDATEAKRRVRVVCDGREVAVYVGGMDKPLQATGRFGRALQRSPDIGYARFRGEDVRVSNIVVRKRERGVNACP